MAHINIMAGKSNPLHPEWGKLLAKVMVVGDIHMSDRDYGQHNNYPQESLNYFTLIGTLANKEQATHLVYEGDLTYKRFIDLLYRSKVEEQLERHHNIVGGNLYCIKGNHDSASYGMTEYEYFLAKKYFHGSTRLRIGNYEFLMVDYGNEYTKQAMPCNEPGVKTVVLAHNWFAFTPGDAPNGVKPIDLSTHPYWFNIEGVVSGHVHEFSNKFGYIKRTDPNTGLVVDGGGVNKIYACQLPCWSRPAFHEEGNAETGEFIMFEVYEHHMESRLISIPLIPLEESFNLSLIEENKKVKELPVAKSIDLTDIINNLQNYSSGFANPEDLIMGMTDKDIRYRKKAIELLKSV